MAWMSKEIEEGNNNGREMNYTSTGAMRTGTLVHAKAFVLQWADHG